MTPKHEVQHAMSPWLTFSQGLCKGVAKCSIAQSESDTVFWLYPVWIEISGTRAPTSLPPWHATRVLRIIDTQIMDISRTKDSRGTPKDSGSKEPRVSIWSTRILWNQERIWGRTESAYGI